MNHHYVKVVACLFFSFSGYGLSFSQNNGPEFLQCSDTPDSLCVLDEGVRLPANNQLYLGEGHPDATSCSVHVTQKKRVRSTCGTTLQYQVLLFLNDTSIAYTLQPVTIVTLDSLGEADLSYNSVESPEQLINNAGIPYTTSCGDYHRIRWVVTDSCGLSAICEQRLKLYDCNPPVNAAQDEKFNVVIPLGCILILFAKDFDNGGIDDCGTSQKLLRSFEQDSYQPTYPIGPCAPAYGVEVPWKIWIADAGVDANCNDFITWSERNKTEHDFSIIFIDSSPVCCEPEEPIVTGKVIKANSTEGVKNVSVTLTEPGHVYPTYVTAADGIYSFTASNTGLEKTIKCERNDHPKNGVTTLDLVRLQKHLLGIQPFTSPYQQIAGDANNSQNVSALDLIEIRKLILGTYSEFPNNKSWRFVPGSISFIDVMSPGNTDFVGVKIGDVNFTANPGVNGPLLPRSLPVADLIATNQNFQKGDVIHIPIRISSDQSLTGFQFTLTAAGMEIIGLLPGNISIGTDDYALFNDRMTISWFDENNIDVLKDDVLFTIQLRAIASGDISQSLSINSDITEAELYVDGEQTFVPQLKIDGPDSRDELSILSCSPNPWKDESRVSFYLPQPGQVTYTITDVNGKRLKSFSENVIAGYQSLILKSSDFANRGMIFVEISAGKEVAAQKMIVLD